MTGVRRLVRGAFIAPPPLSHLGAGGPLAGSLANSYVSISIRVSRGSKWPPRRASSARLDKLKHVLLLFDGQNLVRRAGQEHTSGYNQGQRLHFPIPPASSIFKTWSALMAFSTCRIPLGQRISMELTLVSSPNPKCTRLSLDDMKPTLMATWL